MKIICKLGIHRWDGCKCTLCSETRDMGHLWNGCKCTRCGTTRDEGHSWNGCKCRICRAVRDEQHDWDGCKCRICGRIREGYHQWNETKCVCLKCHRENHDWERQPEESSPAKVEPIGSVDNYSNDEEMATYYTYEVCKKCGTKRIVNERQEIRKAW